MTSRTSRVALVTGACGGLGSAMCRALQEAGTTVVASDTAAQIERSSLGDLVPDLRAADLTIETEISALVQGVLDDHGSCDVLVNNAGYHVIRVPEGKFKVVETTLADWGTTLAVNLTAPFLLARAVLPAMITNRWGRIISITSRSGRTAVPFASAGYSASKAGLAGLTRLLASEVGEHGITVNAIAPGGLIRTPMSTKLDAAAMEKLTADSYVRRPDTEYEGTAEDIAAGVVFLASEAAGFITGIELDINGGMFMA